MHLDLATPRCLAVVCDDAHRPCILRVATTLEAHALPACATPPCRAGEEKTMTGLLVIWLLGAPLVWALIDVMLTPKATSTRDIR
jgi:hypothetical protein